MTADVFLPFFTILLAGLFLSSLFNRLHLPWVAAFLIAGLALGPYGFDVFSVTDPLAFIGEIGLVFLMFMAGLEARAGGFGRELFSKTALLAVLTAAVPFAAGFFIAQAFDYSLTTALLVGVVFMSSSIAVVVPTLEAHKLLEKSIGKVIVGAAVIADVLSLILISVFLQTAEPITTIPLPLFYVLLGFSLLILRFVIPRVHTWMRHLSSKKDVFERELRLVIILLLGTVVLFGALGLHSIIAGFFAGFVLADTIKSHQLRDKLHALAFGIFIPTFFIIVGAQTDFTLLFKHKEALLFTVVIIAGSVSAKMASGYIAGRLIRLGKMKSLLMGAATMPQLSTTLATVFAGASVGLVDDQIMTAMVILSIVTTLLAPLLVEMFSLRTQRNGSQL